MGRKKVGTESKRERFLRLAEKRTQQIIDKLRILGNCSNKYMYEYTHDDIVRIFDAIDQEVHAIKMKFMSEAHEKFKLK